LHLHIIIFITTKKSTFLKKYDLSPSLHLMWGLSWFNHTPFSVIQK